MAVNIQIKRSTGTTAPRPSADGEFAYTHGNSRTMVRLFIGDGSTVNVIGGKSFNEKLDHVDGTLNCKCSYCRRKRSAIDDLLSVTMQQQVVL